MKLPLLLLQLGSLARMALLDDVVTVPRAEWRVLPVVITRQTGTVQCSYRVLKPNSVVRVALLAKEDADRWRKGSPHTEIASIPAGRAGSLGVTLKGPGEYELVVDNREGSSETELHLAVYLLPGNEAGPAVRYVPGERRVVVIGLSAGFFAAVALYAGRKLKRALDERP